MDGETSNCLLLSVGFGLGLSCLPTEVGLALLLSSALSLNKTPNLAPSLGSAPNLSSAPSLGPTSLRFLSQLGLFWMAIGSLLPSWSSCHFLASQDAIEVMSVTD